MKTRVIPLLLRLLAHLPLGAGRALGRALAGLAWILRAGPRRVTERNIFLAFPELSASEQKALAKRSLKATGELAGEMGFVWNRPIGDVRAKVLESRGEDTLRAAMAEGRGVLLLVPHLGNWEVFGLYTAEMGNAMALYAPLQMAALDDMVRAARQRSGSTLVPTTPRGLATLVRHLKSGGIAGILPDQIPAEQESGLNSLFMGVPCFTMTLASKLLVRSGAIAFFAFTERIPGGFRMHYIEAPAEIYSENLPEAVQALNDGIERCVRICPEQYQWEYKRFRERPRRPLDYYSREWTPQS